MNAATNSLKPVPDLQPLMRLWFATMIVGSSLALVYLASGMEKAASTSAADSASAAKAALVSFNAQIQPIFNENCVLCHQGVPGAGEMNLEPGIAYSNLLNKSSESPLMRVTPGAPAASYLIHKLMGTQEGAGGSGARMPYSQPPLDPALTALINQWISQGALNN
jgi:hypothetical protein